MPIISDGNNQIGDEVTDRHMTVGITKHTGSYVISGSGGNYLLVGSDDMTAQISMAPGGASMNAAPHIGIYDNRSGQQPTIGISRGDDTKGFGGEYGLFRFSSTGSVGEGDVLGALTSFGHDGTDFNTAAQIRFAVTGTVATDKMPAKIEFLTNPGSNTTVFPTTRMTIESNGNVGIGTSGQTDKLSVNGDTNIAGELHLDTTEPALNFLESGADRAKIWVNDSDNLKIRNYSSNKHIVFETSDAGVTKEALRIDGSVPEVVVNQGSDSLIDFRVESNNKEHAFFVDGSSNSVLILSGGAPVSADEAAGANVSFYVSGSVGSHGTSEKGTSVFGGDVYISGSIITDQTVVIDHDSTSTDALLLTTVDAGSDAGPIVSLKRTSSSPADADYLGQIKFKGLNDANQEVNYAKITGKIDDASDGSEDGILEFANIKAGSQTITARLRSDSLQLLNETGLSIDGGVGVGTHTPSYKMHVSADAGETPNGISAYFRSADTDYSRIAVDSTANADTQISFMNNGSTKWSIGNEAGVDSFYISSSFGEFGADAPLIINASGNTSFGGDISFPDSLITELSIPGIQLQTHTNAYRFNCPYDLTVSELRLDLDSHGTSGDVTVTLTNTTDSNSMISLTLPNTDRSGNTTTVSNASADAGDILTFAITATPTSNTNGLRAILYFKRDV